jgi:hypothetical protein
MSDSFLAAVQTRTAASGLSMRANDLRTELSKELASEAGAAMVQAFGGDSRCFRRFLVARSNDVIEAAAMFRDTLAFRTEHGLDNGTFKLDDALRDRIKPFWPGALSPSSKKKGGEGGEVYGSGSPKKVTELRVVDGADTKPAWLRAVAPQLAMRHSVFGMDPLPPSLADPADDTDKPAWLRAVAPQLAMRHSVFGMDPSPSALADPAKDPAPPQVEEKQGDDKADCAAGMPMQLFRCGLINTSAMLAEITEEEFAAFYIDWMEKSLALQREATVEGMLEIYDMTGLGPTQVGPTGIGMLTRVLSIGQKHYPENLSSCYIINAPVIFSASWSVLSVMFSATTLDKVVISRDDGGEELLAAVGNQERLAALMGLVPPAQTWSSWFGISSS